MTDLLERLRKRTDARHPMQLDLVNPDGPEAADEIERLQKRDEFASRLIASNVEQIKRLEERLKAGRMKCLDIIDDVDHTTADSHEDGMKYAAQEILRALDGEVEE